MEIIEKTDRLANNKNVKAGDIVRDMISNRKITLTRPGEKKETHADNTEIATAMAATLCHEINNPLMAITAIAEVLLSHQNDLPADVIEKITGISIAAERIRQATHKLIGLDSLKYRETAASRMILTDATETEADSQTDKTVLKSSE